MELQLVFKVWDSLDGLNGRCLNRFGAKRTSKLCYGSQVADAALFFQWKVILSYGMFEGSMGRFLGSRECEKVVSKACTSWFLLMFKFSCFWHVSCFWSKMWELIETGLYRLSLCLNTLPLAPPTCGSDFLCEIWTNAQGIQFWHKAHLSKNGNVPFST